MKPVFLKSDIQRPGFDLAMECLCSLPKEPRSVPMRALVVDLGLGVQADVHVLMEKINARGIKLVVHNREKGRCVSVTNESWKKVETLTEAYWSVVYG